MTAIIPSLQEDGKPYVFHAAADGGPVLMDDHKSGHHRDKMIVMHNKQPHFNKQVTLNAQFFLYSADAIGLSPSLQYQSSVHSTDYLTAPSTLLGQLVQKLGT